MRVKIDNRKSFVKVRYDSMEAVFTNLFFYFYLVLTHLGSSPFIPTVDRKKLTITWTLLEVCKDNKYELRLVNFNRNDLKHNFYITDLFPRKEFSEILLVKDDSVRQGYLLLTDNLKLHEVDLSTKSLKIALMFLIIWIVDLIAFS